MLQGGKAPDASEGPKDLLLCARRDGQVDQSVFDEARVQLLKQVKPIRHSVEITMNRKRVESRVEICQFFGIVFQKVHQILARYPIFDVNAKVSHALELVKEVVALPAFDRKLFRTEDGLRQHRDQA